MLRKRRTHLSHTLNIWNRHIPLTINHHRSLSIILLHINVYCGWTIVYELLCVLSLDAEENARKSARAAVEEFLKANSEA